MDTKITQAESTTPEKTGAYSRSHLSAGSRPPLKLGAKMLRQLLELVEQDGWQDEITIEWWETPQLDGVPQPKGYYAISEEYPEHGGYPIVTFENT